MERRFLKLDSVPVKLEERGEGQLPRVTGYASVFYHKSDPGTEFKLADWLIERVLPGAFDQAITEDDVRALFNHNPDHILGRNLSDTLKLSVDKKGLRYEITPPDSNLARDVIGAIRRGDITGSSFAFQIREQQFRDIKLDDGRVVTVRELVNVELWDVGPVTFPAYSSSTTGIRASSVGDSELLQQIQQWRQSQKYNPVAIDGRWREVQSRI